MTSIYLERREPAYSFVGKYTFLLLYFSISGGSGGNERMTSIYLERREPAHNRYRFYIITVTQTLFDQWAVVREWGRIGQPGTVREAWFDAESAAIEAGAQLRQRKEKRGYRAVGGENQAG